MDRSSATLKCSAIASSSSPAMRPSRPTAMSSRSEGVVYLDAAESGDGRVTLQSAMLPGVRTWTVDCEHGDLPKKRSAFDAYLELLTDGRTERLATVPIAGATRGGASVAAGAAPGRRGFEAGRRASRSRASRRASRVTCWRRRCERSGPRPDGGRRFASRSRTAI